MFTIDASGWLNASSPTEVGRLTSQAFLSAVSAGPFPVYVPNLLRVEVAGMISRTRNDLVLAREFASTLAGLSFLTEVELDHGLAAEAMELAATRRLRGADAVYAAVARIHGCTLVSLDNDHLTRLGGVVIALPPAAALVTLGQNPPPP